MTGQHPNADHPPAVSTSVEGAAQREAPTAGALRAAEIIAAQTIQQLHVNPAFWPRATIQELAALIDEETAARDMLAALRDIQEWLMFPKEITKEDAGCWNEAFVKANNAAVAAIAKAEGRS